MEQKKERKKRPCVWRKFYWNALIILSDDEHREKIKVVAKKQNISVAKLIGRLIKEEIEKYGV